MNLAAITFMCITQFPTTSFIANTRGDVVNLQVIHHNGVEFMPIHEGIIVPHDLELLKQRAEVMRKLGDRMSFRFPLNKCKTYGPEMFYCGSGETQTINGIEVKATGISTTKGSKQAMDYTFDHNEVTLYLEVTGVFPSPYITMRYSPGECTFE